MTAVQVSLLDNHHIIILQLRYVVLSELNFLFTRLATLLGRTNFV